MTYNPNKAVRVKDLISFAEYVKTYCTCNCSGGGSSGDEQGGSSGGQSQSGVTGKFGYRIDKNNSDPYTRVEYLFDAVGKTPAHMDFEKGEFDYGDWSNAWFVTDNKPLMLKSDGTVDYYLNPNDYTLKEDGTPSDVSNTSYDGNAMAQIPLIWIKRYEDENYLYEIISNTQEDEDFYAYAHTRADGSIADYFYWGLFGGSDNSTKIRSLSGQTRAWWNFPWGFINSALANGSNWYIHTWSQRECIRTLLILMGKSTDTQAVFGKGNIHSGGSEAVTDDILITGTLKDKGQFYGYSANNQQVKVFHIEAFWGDMSTCTAGLMYRYGMLYAKMTPEGDGYKALGVVGYVNLGEFSSSMDGYIKECSCSEFGMIPKAAGGSETTYFTDYFIYRNGEYNFLFAGGNVDDAPAFGGAFSADLSSHDCTWMRGCGLSCTMPAA